MLSCCCSYYSLQLQCKNDYLRDQKKLDLCNIYDNDMTKNQAKTHINKSDEAHHSTAIQLRFKDYDSLGHVNNANHLTYMETARMQYFHDVVTKSNDWQKTGLILAKITVDYLKPILLTDNIIAYTKCSRLGNKSFDLAYELRSMRGKKIELMATGLSTIVCFNYEKQETIKIPASWRKKIIAFDHP